MRVACSISKTADALRNVKLIAFFTARMVMRTRQYYVYTYIISVVAHVISCFVDRGYLSLYRSAVLNGNGVVM